MSNIASTYVVRCITMLVYSPTKRSGGVLAPAALQHCSSSGMLIYEQLDVVDEAGNNDEQALLRLVLDFSARESHVVSLRAHLNIFVRSKGVPTALPADHGEVGDLRGPMNGVLDTLEALELHRELALSNLVRGEDAEIGCEPGRGTSGDKPLGGVELVPLDRIPVVHGELMVEVVVALAHCQ